MAVKTQSHWSSSEASKVKRSPFDFLGVVWLLSIPFAPFFGWIVTNAFDIDASNWKMLFGARAFLCVVIPLVCVLPLIRYVRGKPAPFLVAVLGVGTAFPVLTDLRDEFVKLADSRTLARSNAARHVHGGAIELLVLPASEIILDARG